MLRVSGLANLARFVAVRYNPTDLLGRMLGRKMARETKRLTAAGVKALSAPGLHADGDSLYLRVDGAGAKRWVLLFRWPDPETGKLKRMEMGLGRLKDVGLADAREKASEARRLIGDGINPIEARAASAALRAKPAQTFGMVAERHINTHATTFRNTKHIDQWRMTLSVQRDDDGTLLDTGYCLAIRNKPVDQVETEQVLGVLKPLWQEKPETGSRVRGRIERVIDAAKAEGLRSGENPARWRGHLDKLLPKRPTLTRGHHAAMPYAAVPEFVGKLREAEGVGALALEFLILTTSRTGEVIGAKAHEFDLAKTIWVVPPERMKSGREHRVPLCARAVEIVTQLREVATSEWVFAAARRPISNMTMTKALGTAGGENFTVHGFRSSFRDWVGEETNFADTLAEAALAHVIGDKTERAYRRGDALEKRRGLMEAWERYCTPPAGSNVITMPKRAS
jgi:integrase